MNRASVAILVLATATFAGVYGPSEAAPAGSIAASSCETLTVTDPRGDAAIWPTNLPYDAPPADFLAHTLLREPGHLVMVTEVAGRPPESLTESYRYWLGFDVDTPSRPPESIDVRIHFGQYVEGSLVGPNSRGNELLATLPVTWSDAAMTIRIPNEVLYDYFGADVQVGNPEAFSDGVHRIHRPQGVPTGGPYVIDVAGEWTTAGFVPLECAA